MLRDPHETIVRNVLIIPADGGEPRITPMTFSEEGARANPHAFYTIGVDLRGLYGERNMHATRTKGGDVTNQPEKIVEGEYDLFFNISPKLPANVTMARIVGADPKRPGDRPLWRGDVVLVKTTEWPAPMPPGGGNHMDYLNVPPQAIELFTCHMIPNWYQSDQWGNFLKTEREYNATSWNNNPEKDRKKYGKTARMLDRLEATPPETKNIQRQNLDSIVACGHCKVSNGVSLAEPLRVCSGCRNEKYCSKECQKLAWNGHKAVCRRTG
ncbi:hypothetical protein B0H11DRAFT_2046692 [Mycena galericulata]|nr:hypothetical protein B0H11DRAFT_2046692 [Mycena galericulata]